jgi:cysteine-rich repeat protein
MRLVATALFGLSMTLVSCAEGTNTTNSTTTSGNSASSGEAGQGGAGGAGGSAGKGGMGGAGGSGAMAGMAGMGGMGGGGGLEPKCGNGLVDPGEDCDGMTDQTCEGFGYVGGPLTCNPNCTFDLSICSSCGDGVIQLALGEECDFDGQGDPLVTATCKSLGFLMSGANPGCSASCKHDVRICRCGNGQVDNDEPCDAADLDGKTCITEGFGSGTLVCTPDCNLDLSGCSMCGNGMIDMGETCDGMNLDGKTCVTEGFGGGNLGCSANCQLDTSACDPCGNGAINLGESCDGANLGGQSCLSLGFGSGQLACSSTCSLDTSNCNPCGNQVLEMGEMCDGGNLNGQTCITQGFGSGQLACSAMCSFDTSGCNPCGNDKIDGTEACDGMDLGGRTCVSIGFGGGTLSCSPTCTLNTSGCTTCGNGTIQNGEACDDGNTTSGDGCSSTCQIEITMCDPDGTYLIQGAPISYSCCFGLVSVNVSSFIFNNNGSVINSSPSNPVAMNGNQTTCPSGSFTNQGTLPGGCAETYKLTGSFTGNNTWTGTYEVQFVGPDCGCFNGAGTPCVSQIYSITATR